MIHTFAHVGSFQFLEFFIITILKRMLSQVLRGCDPDSYWDAALPMCGG